MCPIKPPPFSAVEPVTEIFHGISVTDPYRWLEDGNSAQTRKWIEEQTSYARAYLGNLPGRDRIRERVRELLDVETYDSFLKSGGGYFFRKRLPGEEQPSIYVRRTANGPDELLINPASRGTGNYTAVKPLRVSQDGSLLLYEVKQGGERTGTFELFDVKNHRTLPDTLPRGFLRGFAFTPSSKSFYYVHEVMASKRPFYRAVFHHVLGTGFEKDQECFCAGEDENLRLVIVPGERCLGLLVYRFLDKTYTDFYLLGMGATGTPVQVLRGAEYSFVPRFHEARILAMTDRGAPNRRIVEVQPRRYPDPCLFDLVGETDAQIEDWLVTANHLVVSYARGGTTQVEVFDVYGKHLGQIPSDDETMQLLAADLSREEEIVIRRESILRPPELHRYALPSGVETLWDKQRTPFSCEGCNCARVVYQAKDCKQIPMFLAGRSNALSGGTHPTVMTAYGGFGIPMTPQFSALVAFLIERGCLFALPNIRGGSEFGVEWHDAAKRRNRQTAFDDFLCAAEWLIRSGQTTRERLAVFGGSNSGLLVAAALTQRPDLFCAVLCMVPILDMLRYHLFDNARVWKDELGTAEDPGDFATLFGYSPYHRVRDRTAYPATLIVSGDSDQNCNPFHARKMVARLQAANSLDSPVVLDYSAQRGHSPVLPLCTRIDALTDRLGFLCHEMGLRL